MAAQAISGASNLLRVVVLGGAAAWGVSNSLFNVEGGHRAIVFNRVAGIKDTVRGSSSERHGMCACALLRKRKAPIFTYSA